VATLCPIARAETAPPTAVLRVGTSGDYAPFSFRTPSGELSGFDIAVAQRLAGDLGRRVEFVPFHWPDLVTQLRASAFDIAMSGVTVRADRAVSAAFSRPYAMTGAVAAIRSSDQEKFRSVTDLDNKNVRVAVNRGGHLEQVARRRFTHAQLIPVADNTSLPGLLTRGEADAVISDDLEARAWTAAPLTTLGPFTHDRKAYGLPREAGELLRQVNDWLAAREADGWLNEQRRRWLGEQAVRTPEQASIEALVAAMDLRLQLMPLVAAVKRREHLPIEDRAQEGRVLERVRSVAAAAELHPDDVAELFRIQMEAAKAIEHTAPAATAPPDATLADLRAAVAAASDRVIGELAHCQPWLAEPRWRDQLGTSLPAGLTAPGAERFATPLLDAIQHVRRSRRPSSVSPTDAVEFLRTHPLRAYQ
jgi:cyclohexadienyl dehydratase